MFLANSDETGDIGITLDEMMPVIKNSTSGIGSALQLTDTTSSIAIISDSTDYT